MEKTPNKEQLRVISDFENNIILFASAGTGKTFTVANKVREILSRGLCKPEEILCLTFTIKACGEMKEDITGYNPQAKEVRVKTIHGFCLDFLKEEYRRAGACGTDLGVYDEVDEEEILSALIPEYITRIRLGEFIKAHSIADSVSELFAKDVQYIAPYGFFWKVNHFGRDAYLSSDCRILLPEQVEGLIKSPPQKPVCPECRKRQEDYSNICAHCGFDFRTYVKPADFGRLRNLRSPVSTLKRYREISKIYGGGESEDYNATLARLRNTDPQTFAKMFGGRTGNELFEGLFCSYAGELVAQYNAVLRASDKFDFDDLIVETSQLLREPHVAERWRGAFKYIFVDEMQDTSALEYSLLKQLFSKTCEITDGRISRGNRTVMCGDVAQTIYEWRGSRPFEILEDFRAEFGAKIYMLGENYRSTHMLNRASFGFLKSVAPEIFGKYCPAELKTGSESAGEPIRVVALKNARAEAEFVLRYLRQHRELSPSEVCVMSRSNNYITNFYWLISAANDNLPQNERLSFFTADREFKFYKRPVIKDVLAFAAILLNPYDYENCARAVEKYANGIGRATLSAIRAQSGCGASVSAFLEPETYSAGDCFQTLIDEYAKGNCVIYDTETTGLDVSADEIIQIAAVKLDARGNVAERFERLVIPAREISAGALATHGYCADYLKSHGGVDAKTALADFSAFVKGSALIGHNSKNFDRAVVDRQLAENGLPSLDIAGEYDTLSLARLFIPQSVDYKLSTLCEKFGIVNARAHDAFEDVLATAAVLGKLVNRCILPAAAERRAVISKYRDKFLPFYNAYAHLRAILKSDGPAALYDGILNTFAVAENYPRSSDTSALEDLKGIFRAQKGNPETALRTLIAEAALSGSQMDILIKRLNKIPLVTVHQSKGCEFDTVLIIGADDLNFPARGAVTDGNLREEERVFYVALSRAKTRLIITYHTDDAFNCARRRSAFIDEIPADCIRNYEF